MRLKKVLNCSVKDTEEERLKPVKVEINGEKCLRQLKWRNIYFIR